MQLTRQQILDYLQSNRAATPVEMSRALQVTAANIRHHLRILRAAGLVEVVGTRPVRGRGRPRKLYSLTAQALQDNLAALSGALLAVLLEDAPDTEAALRRVAAAMLGDCHPPASAHARLNRAVERLNDFQYHAAWEASPAGPRVILRNCPYAPILKSHPELCRLDAALLAMLLVSPVEQTARLARSPEGAPHCAFVLR